MGNRRDPKNTKVKNFRLALNKGPQVDGGPEDVLVADSNNMRLLPSGDDLVNRHGSELYRQYKMTTSPVGRKALIMESAPPYTNLGNLFMIVNTATGAIECGEIVRNRTEVEGEVKVSEFSFETDSVFVGPIDQIALSLHRDGDISTGATVQYATADGTAVAGVDYTADSGTKTFLTGSRNPTTNITTTVLIFSPDLYYYVYLLNPSSNGILGEISRIRINLQI